MFLMFAHCVYVKFWSTVGLVFGLLWLFIGLALVAQTWQPWPPFVKEI